MFNYGSKVRCTKQYLLYHNNSYIWNGKSSKLSMFVYYIMKIHRLLRQFDWIILEGVIVLFDIIQWKFYLEFKSYLFKVLTAVFMA